MPIGSSPAAPSEAEASREVAVEIEVAGRWDALALSERLVSFHSFLVQHADERWVVHARAPGCHGEPLTDALRAIEEWRAERRVNAPLRITDRPKQAVITR